MSQEPPRDTPPTSADAGPEPTPALPELAARSVILALDPQGKLGPGLRLKDLEGEAKLPELALGSAKYRVLGVLGEGGMANVYLAHDQDLKRNVALKVVKADGTDQSQRFLDEAQVIAQLEHPYIVPIHEVGLTEAKRLYYTMPVVRGRTLRDVLEGLRNGDPALAREWSLARRIQALLQVCQGVGYAHAKGVAHRDLKPANVMVGSHGEIQVMDWGLSKMVAVGGIVTDHAPTLTGQVMGTPWYMSPEQAQGLAADARADVWSLGVMLYELLTLQRPFEGGGFELLAAVVRDEPAPPRLRAPDLQVPLELERMCLRALAKSPAERYETASGLAAGLQAWLEAEADKARRHERAEAKAAEGRALLERHRQLKEDVVRLEAEAKAARRRFEGWQPVEQKREIYAAEDAAARARRAEVQGAAAVVAALQTALGFEDDNATARALMAEYYWGRFVVAEEARDERSLAFLAERVASYDDGRFSRELRGDGSLTLASDPAGAEVWLHDLVEEGPVLVERGARRLGMTPLPETPLGMGSYLVVLKREGYRDTRYPVCITRNRAWRAEARLFTDEEIGDGFIHVPAGPCTFGGDAEAWNPLPRWEAWTEDFFIAEHPVTMEEYLEYVSHVRRKEGLEAAKLCSPRRATDVASSSYLLEDGAGGLKLPEVDREGDRWRARWPAYGVSFCDALSYCAWRSEREGREYRLPTDEEWEKAARGVDGRWFPWGWRFDPSLCNMRESLEQRPMPVTVDDDPRDRSVYGVRGLGGNVRDWTSTENLQGRGESRRVFRMSRGGHWGGSARDSRAASRNGHAPSWVHDDLGFRLARSPR